MNSAAISLTNLDQFTGAHYAGVSFSEEIKLGLPVVARPELPKLRFNDDASPEVVRREVKKWNQLLSEQFEGAGYYAPSQEDEDLLNDNVFVLFADDVFYDNYVSGTAVSEVVLNVPAE